jgi:hypothetical protein
MRRIVPRPIATGGGARVSSSPRRRRSGRSDTARSVGSGRSWASIGNRAWSDAVRVGSRVAATSASWGETPFRTSIPGRRFARLSASAWRQRTALPGRQQTRQRLRGRPASIIGITAPNAQKPALRDLLQSGRGVKQTEKCPATATSGREIATFMPPGCPAYRPWLSPKGR